jgi:signal transduction histidine kinase
VISKGIIEAHGGEIWVESKLGEGSSFAFSLPVAGPIPRDDSLGGQKEAGVSVERS